MQPKPRYGRSRDVLVPVHATFLQHGLFELSEVKDRRIGELLLR
jgi:hypothetical protein